MRTTIKLATCLIILISFNLMAQESYKAPKLKESGTPGYENVKMGEAADWDSSYRVEERVEGERSIASDQEAPKKAQRNPSSEVQEAPRMPFYWKYKH